VENGCTEMKRFLVSRIRAPRAELVIASFDGPGLLAYKAAVSFSNRRGGPSINMVAEPSRGAQDTPCGQVWAKDVVYFDVDENGVAAVSGVGNFADGGAAIGQGGS